MSSLLDSVILYVVSLGDDPSSFFFSRPCGEIAAGLFLCGPAWSHLLQNLILPVSLCSDFYIKECRAIYSTSFMLAKIFAQVFPKSLIFAM